MKLYEHESIIARCKVISNFSTASFPDINGAVDQIVSLNDDCNAAKIMVFL